jgi:hypothetical protein
MEQEKAFCINDSGMNGVQLVKPSAFAGLSLLIDNLISRICKPGFFEVPLGIYSMILCYESSISGRWTIYYEFFIINFYYRDKNK